MEARIFKLLVVVFLFVLTAPASGWGPRIPGDTTEPVTIERDGEQLRVIDLLWWLRGGGYIPEPFADVNFAHPEQVKGHWRKPK